MPLFYSGCKNDLNLLAPYKDVTVVYGLLDQNDTTHYIRINKGYEGPGNALTMAQQYDSINYPIGTLSVVLLDYDAFGDPPTTITLGTTMGIPVAPGIFSYPNQVEYYTKAVLNPNDKFELQITNNKTEKKITGSTYLLPDIALNMGFPSSYLPLSWNPAVPSTIQWNSVTNGAIYQMVLRFFYTETNVNVHTTAHLFTDWVFPPQVTTSTIVGQSFQYQYTGHAFLQFLKSAIQPAGVGVTRVCDSIEIRFSSGSSDFAVYSTLAQPSLSVNQSQPFYTDLQNGIGIFSARHTQEVGKLLSTISLDSIETVPLTSDLGF